MASWGWEDNSAPTDGGKKKNLEIKKKDQNKCGTRFVGGETEGEKKKFKSMSRSEPLWGENSFQRGDQRGCASLQEAQGSCLCLCRTQKENLSPCRWHRPSLAAPRLGDKKLERPRPQEEAGRAAPPSSVSFESAPGLPKNPRDRAFPAPCRTAQALGEDWLLHFLLPNRRMRQPRPTSDPPPPPAPRISGSTPCHHTSCNLLATSTLTHPVCSLCQLHPVILNPGISWSGLAEDLARPTACLTPV